MIYKSLLTFSLLATVSASHNEIESKHPATHHTPSNHVLKTRANGLNKITKNKKSIKDTHVMKSIRDRVAPFSEKVHKAKHIKANHKAKSDSRSLLETTDFDEQSSSLRGLRVRDNFVGYSFYSDSSCSTKYLGFGSLVNHCFNLKDGTSYLMKTAKKDKVLVQLDYDGHDCRGIPTRVTDLVENELYFDYWDECFNSYFPYTGFSYKVEYLTTYPSKSDDGLVYFTDSNPGSQCDNTQYFSYNSLAPNTCISFSDYESIYLDASDCDSYVEQTGYYDSSCTNEA